MVEKKSKVDTPATFPWYDLSDFQRTQFLSLTYTSSKKVNCETADETSIFNFYSKIHLFGDPEFN